VIVQRLLYYDLNHFSSSFYFPPLTLMLPFWSSSTHRRHAHKKPKMGRVSSALSLLCLVCRVASLSSFFFHSTMQRQYFKVIRMPNTHPSRRHTVMFSAPAALNELNIDQLLAEAAIEAERSEQDEAVRQEQSESSFQVDEPTSDDVGYGAKGFGEGWEEMSGNYIMRPPPSIQARAGY